MFTHVMCVSKCHETRDFTLGRHARACTVAAVCPFKSDCAYNIVTRAAPPRETLTTWRGRLLFIYFFYIHRRRRWQLLFFFFFFNSYIILNEQIERTTEETTSFSIFYDVWWCLGKTLNIRNQFNHENVP